MVTVFFSSSDVDAGALVTDKDRVTEKVDHFI